MGHYFLDIQYSMIPKENISLLNMTEPNAYFDAIDNNIDLRASTKWHFWWTLHFTVSQWGSLRNHASTKSLIFFFYFYHDINLEKNSIILYSWK